VIANFKKFCQIFFRVEVTIPPLPPTRPTIPPKKVTSYGLDVEAGVPVVVVVIVGLVLLLLNLCFCIGVVYQVSVLQNFFCP
jgi:hypothetical protein